MARVFRARIGRQRITKGIRPSEASYTRSIRSQMEQLEQNLSAVITQLKDVTPAVLEVALRPTFQKALNRTPVDTGDLKASGYLETRTGTHVKAEIGFGKRGNPHYTAFVHERVDVPHKAPTQAKFLQSAIEEDLDEIPKRLERAYEGMLKS